MMGNPLRPLGRLLTAWILGILLLAGAGTAAAQTDQDPEDAAAEGAAAEGAAEAERRISTTGKMVRRRLYIAPVESETIPEERLRLFYELFKTWAAENTDVVLEEIESKAGCRLDMAGETLPGTRVEDRSYRLEWRLEDLAFPERDPVSGSREMRGMTMEDYYQELFPTLGERIQEVFPRVEQKQIEVVRKRIVEEVVIKERFEDGVTVTLTGEPETRFRYRDNEYEIGETGRLILEAPPNTEMKIRASRQGRLSDRFEFFVGEEEAEFDISLRKGARWGLDLMHRVPDMAPAPGILYFIQPGKLFVQAYVEQNFLVYTYGTGDSAGDDDEDEDEEDASFWENPEDVDGSDSEVMERLYQPTFFQPVLGVGHYVWGDPDSWVRSSVHLAAFTRVVVDGDRDPSVYFSEIVTGGLQLGLMVEASPFERWRLVGGVHPRLFYSHGYRDKSLGENVILSNWVRPAELGSGFYFQYSGVMTISLRVLL